MDKRSFFACNNAAFLFVCKFGFNEDLPQTFKQCCNVGKQLNISILAEA